MMIRLLLGTVTEFLGGGEKEYWTSKRDTLQIYDWLERQLNLTDLKVLETESSILSLP